MCSIMAASMAMSVVQGVMSFQEQRQQADDAEAEANYRSQVDVENAKRAEYLAEDAEKRGKTEQRKEEIRTQLAMGALRAGVAANGVVVDEGSSMDMLVDEAGAGKLRELETKNNADREAQDFRIRSDQFTSNAALTQVAGTNKANAARSKATGTLLSTAGSVASKWYKFSTAGTA